MQSKYGKDGVVSISVSLDDPTDKEAQEKVRKFLESEKATITNFILDEKTEVWQERLKIEGPPCIFIYGRDGKVAKKFNEGQGYDDVEKVVLDLLKKN
jgi:hypothetical protein